MARAVVERVGRDSARWDPAFVLASHPMRAAGLTGVLGETIGLALAVVVGAAPAYAEGERDGRSPRVAAVAAGTLELSVGSRGVALELVLVPAGSFRQGSPGSERGRGSDEATREVSLTRDYYIGKYEVTVEQFAAFVEDTQYVTEAERGRSGGYGFDGKKLTQSPRYSWREPGYPQSDRHPVSLVTHADAQEFSRWLSEAAGRAIDLPTEAEWERASRAGTSTRFYGGGADEMAPRIGWFAKNAPHGARAVGQLAPNGMGLHDMAGNVHEWCRDWYGPYEPAGRATDPVRETPPAGEQPRRVLRGGSFLRSAKDLRSAARYRNDPGSRNADNGFRIVASTSASPAAAAERALERTVSVPASSPGIGGGAATREAPSSFWSRWSALKLGILAAAGLLGASVVLSLVRGLRRRGGSRRSGSRPRGDAAELVLKPARDGFWVVAPERLRGHTLRYRVSGPAGAARAAVELEPNPGGQFVYTGYRPGSVTAEQVLFAGAAAGVAWNARQGREEDDEEGATLAAAPAPFRNYPSAY
jgi:formylglycine-generating enzyme